MKDGPTEVPGEIYGLSNISYRGRIKIGKTQRTALDRAQELSTSSPFGFEVEFSIKCKNIDLAESLIHKILKSKNENNEYFIIEKETAENYSRRVCDFINSLFDQSEWPHSSGSGQDGAGTQKQNPIVAIIGDVARDGEMYNAKKVFSINGQFFYIAEILIGVRFGFTDKSFDELHKILSDGYGKTSITFFRLASNPAGLRDYVLSKAGPPDINGLWYLGNAELASFTKLVKEYFEIQHSQKMGSATRNKIDFDKI